MRVYELRKVVSSRGLFSWTIKNHVLVIDVELCRTKEGERASRSTTGRKEERERGSVKGDGNGGRRKEKKREHSYREERREVTSG